jgi:hypothetical protein
MTRGELIAAPGSPHGYTTRWNRLTSEYVLPENNPEKKSSVTARSTAAAAA